MRYISENEQTELYCLPFIEQFISDIIGNKCSYKFIHVPNGDTRASKETNKVLLYLQYKHTDIIIDYGARKPAYIDFKGTKGIGDFEGYYKLTMELYYRQEYEPTVMHHKSWPFLVKAFPNNTQHILYASKLIMILIPKEQLNKVMNTDKYKYKFNASNIEWKLDYSDKKEKRMVKNIVFDLRNDKDIDILLEAGALFYRLIDDTYKQYDPLNIKPQQIRKDYLNTEKRYIIKNK